MLRSLGSLPLRRHWARLAGIGRALSTTPPAEPPQSESPPKLSMSQRFKKMSQEHGIFAIAYYSSLYVGMGASVFGLLETGIVDSTLALRGAQSVIETVGLGQYFDVARVDPRLGNLAVAIAINEMLEVIRFPFVLATIPPAHRLFDRIKPWKSDPESSSAMKLPFFGVYYGGLWGAMWLGTYSLLLAVGADPVIHGVDYVLNGLGLPPNFSNKFLDSTAGYAVMAVVLNEMLEPVRLPLALATFPAFHRALVRRWKI